MAEVASGLLTATAVLTGFTFSIATAFWNKTIEAAIHPRAYTQLAQLVSSTGRNTFYGSDSPRLGEIATREEYARKSNLAKSY